MFNFTMTTNMAKNKSSAIKRRVRRLYSVTDHMKISNLCKIKLLQNTNTEFV